jgi:hypothetical protein
MSTNHTPWQQHANNQFTIVFTPGYAYNRGSEIDSNNAESAGGLACFENSTAELLNTAVVGNYADSNGAGLLLRDTARVRSTK